MSYKCFIVPVILATTSLAVPQAALAQVARSNTENSRALTDTIVVTGVRTSETVSTVLGVPKEVALPADAAAIAARAAGGALVGNGALSGQLSYRGLSGERVLSTVNGQRFVSGGPNAMDPPLHYAPSILVDHIEIARGVASVSQGPSLAGAVNAELIQTQFASSDAIKVIGHYAAQYRSVDDSYAVGGVSGVATDSWRLGVMASREEGKDYDFPGGSAADTSFERVLYGVHGGFQAGPGELYIEYRRSETDPSGNPPFPMDIIYFNTDFLRAGFRGELADNIGFDLSLGHVAIRHKMDNYSLRSPAPTAGQSRATIAEADTSTAEAVLRFGSEDRRVSVGVDAETTDKAVRITNPFNDAFFLDAQPNLAAERFGGFIEWRDAIGPVEFQLGSRVDRTRQSAGIPQLGSAIPTGPRALVANYVASDRIRSETTFDVVLQGWVPMGILTPRITLAHKTRVPSLLERFAWLPTEASYGLADGNIYVGNLDLKPEKAWIVELGVDVESDGIMFRPSAYYRRIDDYVQGTPHDATVGIIDTPVEMVAAMNGDSTPLEFRNTDAELYGIDLDFSLRPVERIEVSGTASYVRGKRRDIDDNLYRLAPASLRTSVVWIEDTFSLGAEGLFVAKQDKVSVTNSERTSKGYAVFGLFGRLAITDGAQFEAGVENLFDTYYQGHLSGVNRVGDSDVAVGDRLPGAGRGYWLRVSASY